MSVVSLSQHSGLIQGEQKVFLEKAVAFILSDSSFAQECMFDRYGPGNKYTSYGCEFVSPFKVFRHAGSGIGGMIGTTFISWLPGTIEDKTVIFVHPTSNTVNYDEVIKGLEQLKNIPVISFDGNAICRIKSLVGV